MGDAPPGAAVAEGPVLAPRRLEYPERPAGAAALPDGDAEITTAASAASSSSPVTLEAIEKLLKPIQTDIALIKTHGISQTDLQLAV
eukprot:7645148-Pyramimonas_sp.AAC.1